MRKKSLSLALAVALLLSVTAVFTPMVAEAAIGDPGQEGHIPGWSLIWHDEFDGSGVGTAGVDQTKWSFQEQAGGFGNREMQRYRAQNASVSDGMLNMHAEPQPGKTPANCYQDDTFYSTKLWTTGKFSVTYGRIEAKISLPLGEGFWPAFWMMPQGNSYGSGWPNNGEIDIMEAKGRFPKNSSGAIHRQNDAGNGNAYLAADRPMPGTQTINDWHVYAVEWDPGEIRWYVDGDLFQTRTSATWRTAYYRNNYPNNPYAPFDKPFYLILNLACGGNFDAPSYPGSNGGPKTGDMKVDFVRVYQRDTGYSISLSETGTYSFPPVAEGYGTQTARSVTVGNTGTKDTGALTVALSGTNASSFTLSTASLASIAADGSADFTVRPNTGLAPGTYTATVTVSNANVGSKNFGVSFTVRAPYGISLSQSGTYTFSNAMEGYGARTPLPVTVTNAGANATGDLTVVLSGTNAASFTLNKAGINSIAVDGTDTFTVTPNDGLDIGTYTATVTVTGTNVGSKSFNVSFTVTELRPDSDSIALRKPIKASYVEGGNVAANANDGDGVSRWSSYNNPAGNWNNWIEVDLGDSYILTKQDIAWYTSATRNYRYEVWAKNTPDSDWNRPIVFGRDFAAEGYTRIIDKTASTSLGDSTDVFAANVTARYLVIKVTGSSAGGLTAAINEWSVYGWRLTSASYVIDQTAKTIDVPAGVTPAAFLSGLSLQGNAIMKLNSVGTVKDGDKLSVTDVNGGVFAYTLHVAASGGVKVTGSVKSYNPGSETTVRLMQGDAEKYKTTIESKPGSGPDTQSFEFNGVAPGEYTLVITKDAHTSFTVQKITVGGADLDLTKDSRDEVKLMSLLCGDISGDDMINDGDLAILWLAANYNKSAADAGVNVLCDLNGDGMINDGDLAILWLAVNYNKGAVVAP